MRRRRGTGIWHVFNRGARRMALFHSEEDYGFFLHLVGRYAAKHKVALASYVLMPNHYHLQVQASSSALSVFMRDLNRDFARRFNERHEESGRVFDSPFHAYVARTPHWTVRIGAYVHLNPVRAKLVRSPEDWTWSSYRGILTGRGAPAFLKPKLLLDLYGGDGKQFAAFMRERTEAVQPTVDEPAALLSELLTWAREESKRVLSSLPRRGRGPSTERILAAHLARGNAPVSLGSLSASLGYESPQSLSSALWQFQKTLDRRRDLAQAVK